MEKACRACSKNVFTEIIDLGEKPIAHRIPKSADEKEEVFPLSLHLCDNCDLIQVLEPIDPEILYLDYNYCFTHWKPEPHQDKEIDILMNLAGNESVFEIGCNDGTFLEKLKEKGMKTLVGLEPNKVSGKMAKDKGFFVYDDMVNPEICQKAVEKFGKFQTVASRQVLEHIPDIDNFLNCVNILLKEDGFLFIDVPNVEAQLKIGDISMIWEEHVNYFSELVIKNIFADYGFEVVNINNYNFSGTIMSLIAKKKKKVAKEDTSKIKKIAQDFESKVRKYGFEFKQLLKDFKNKGYKIVIYGVGCRACTFVNGHDLKEHIDFAIDDQKERQEKYMPGSKLPIKSPSVLDNYEGNLLCLLAVNQECEEAVMKKLKKNSKAEIEFALIQSPNDIWADLDRLKRL